VTEDPTPAPENAAPHVDAPKSAPETSPVAGVFTQANITLGLSILAVILAAAPYVVPQLQAYQVRAGLMARPSMLQDASVRLRELQTAEAAARALEGIKTRQTSLFQDKSDPVLGNPNAPIKIVEFLDYNCGYCRAAAPKLKAFLADNPDVAIIVKEYPVINQNSRPLAAFALGAAKTGQYEAMHYALMEATISSDADMMSLLNRTGLDVKAVSEAAASKEVHDHIDRVVTLGTDLNLTGTPMFIIGTKLIDGAKIDDIKAAVVAERARLKKS
jgi:protein-disulfide isomerase